MVSDDGKTAFVSHAVGSVLSVVDLADAKHETRQVGLRGWEPGQIKNLELRRKAMSSNKRIVQIAEAVVTAHELMGN